MKKTHIILIATLAVFAGLATHLARTNEPLGTPVPALVSTSSIPDGISVQEAPPAPPGTISFVVNGDSYAATTALDENVLDVMRSLASSTSFTFTGRDYIGLGFFVDSINGKRASGGSDWFLYVNGEFATKGVSQTPVHPGDTIEWRYEKDH